MYHRTPMTASRVNGRPLDNRRPMLLGAGVLATKDGSSRHNARFAVGDRGGRGGGSARLPGTKPIGAHAGAGAVWPGESALGRLTLLATISRRPWPLPRRRRRGRHLALSIDWFTARANESAAPARRHSPPTAQLVRRLPLSNPPLQRPKPRKSPGNSEAHRGSGRRCIIELQLRLRR